MKSLVLTVVVTFLVPISALAMSEGGRLSIGGHYGLGSVSPSDINTYQQNLGTTPPIGSITTSTLYGADLGIMLSWKWQLAFSYELQDAKNPTNITAPSAVNGAGFELQQNEIWAGLNYFLIHNSAFEFYIGGFAGYPTYSHAILTNATRLEGDADKTTGYMGKAGVGVKVGSHLTLFFEGGYQSIVSGNIVAAGSPITVNGRNAKMDLSGGRADAGLTINF